MEFNKYQELAARTAKYPNRDTIYGLMYTALGLGGETGEVLETVKKRYRDGDADTRNLQAELGDVLWYVSQLAWEVGLSLEGIAIRNLEKLADRQRRGVLGGSGDNR